MSRRKSKHTCPVCGGNIIVYTTETRVLRAIISDENDMDILNDYYENEDEKFYCSSNESHTITEETINICRDIFYSRI